MNSVLTIPLPSGIINAIVFLFFDFLLLTLFASVLQSLQWRFVLRRLLQGRTVKLSDSRYGALAVGIRNDHSLLHHVLVLVHFVFLLLLFLHTLAINGRTAPTTSPISRSFVTVVAANESDFGIDRISARQFSNCSIYSEPSIAYYPLAFDTIPPRNVTEPVGLRDESGFIVPFNFSSFVCQTFNLQPLIVVPTCGDSELSCNNLNISSPINLVATRTRHQFVKPIIKYAGNPPPLLVFHLNAHLENDSLSEQHLFRSYNRLICRQIPIREAGSNSDGLVSFNCLFGLWNDNASLFTFRLGSATTTAEGSSIETWNTLADLGLPLTFTATTAQMSIEWRANLSGEDIFVESLFALKNDRLTARAFLDMLVARAVVPSFVDADNTHLREQALLSVTDIHVGAVVGYLVMLVFVLIVAITLRVIGEGDEHNILNWGGLSQMLRSIFSDETTGNEGALHVSMRSLEKQLIQSAL